MLKILGELMVFIIILEVWNGFLILVKKCISGSNRVYEFFNELEGK